ncbi:MAG: RraA family protein [Alphaproteobacteria bacterium]
MTSEDIVDRLGKLDTPAVSDALDRLDQPGRVIHLRRLTTDKRIAGRVLTVKLGTGAALGGPTRHLCTAAVEAAGPGDVLVIEQRSGIDAAGWGGILSNGAKARGIEGVICDGPVRDVDESRDLGFPVFAERATPTTARGRIVEEAFNEAITVGDHTVSPGDYVLADGSGICFLQADRAAEIIEVAETIAIRESLMTEAVLAGDPISQVMGADYEKMLD